MPVLPRKLRSVDKKIKHKNILYGIHITMRNIGSSLASVVALNVHCLPASFI